VGHAFPIRETGPVRITIRVKPGAAKNRVGGTYGEGQLVVAVTTPAVDGRATAAALRAVAEAFGLKRSAVTLVTGSTNRTKVIDLQVDAPSSAERLAELLNHPPASGA
jgi:uncharacterized protein YggU (UPF0235/DUF167 family)